MTRATVTAAAGVAQVGRRTIYRWVAEGHVTKHDDGTVDLEQVLTMRDFYADAPRRVHRDTQTRSRLP